MASDPPAGPVRPGHPDPRRPSARPLCPACAAPIVRVTVEASLLLDVVRAAADEDDGALRVVRHEWDDASWANESRAACARCEWEGRVGDLEVADAAAVPAAER